MRFRFLSQGVDLGGRVEGEVGGGGFFGGDVCCLFSLGSSLVPSCWRQKAQVGHGIFAGCWLWGWEWFLDMGAGDGVYLR